MPISDNKKVSNKKYCTDNKLKIAEKLYKKEECLKCHRIVSHQNINKHQKSKLCQGRSEKSKIDELIAKVDRIEKLINEKIENDYDSEQNGYDGFSN